MQEKIKILHLEDSEADSILVSKEIGKTYSSFEYFNADNRKDFLKILAEEKIDIVLSDFELPGYSGTDALAVIKERYPEIPFIFVSGVMGEDAAIASLLNGALDYVIKAKLQRLVPAITRALREASLLKEQKIADTERRKLSRAVEQSSVSVIITDITGIIEYVNPKVIEITGYSKDELIGKYPSIFKSGKTSQQFYDNLWKVIRSGNQWKGEILNRKKGGDFYWELMSISPVFGPDGLITHFVSIKEDITRQKILIEELQAAKEKAEAGDRLKMAFIQNISHEIRTPLNGILGISEFVLQQNINSDDRTTYLEILNASSERLISTVTNYLDISLIESGTLIYKPVINDIGKVLNGIYQSYKPKCQAKGLKFICKIPYESEGQLVFCDSDLLVKALNHIIDNSVKFTNSGEIEIGVNIAGPSVEIFISDTGSGIEKDELNNVFHVFFQEKHTLNRDSEGSGLGLSISRGIIEKMGGSIKINSILGEGTHVTITFPKYNEKMVPSGNVNDQLLPGAEGSLNTILVADDNWANLTFYKIIIESASHKFISASNGFEAAEMCLVHPEISLVMIDTEVPGMDGLATSGKIREFRPDLPVIFISNDSFSDIYSDSPGTGINGYLSKPVRGAQLLLMINRFLPGNYSHTEEQ